MIHTDRTRLLSRLAAAALLLLLTACAAAPTAAPASLGLPASTAAARLTTAPTAPQPGLTPAHATALPSFDLRKGPDLIFTGKNTEMKIFWQGEPAARYRLEWGLDAAYTLGGLDVPPSSDPDTLYTQLISGLQPGTRYFYRVVSDGKASASTFFTAPPADATRLKFVVYGDTRTQPELHEAVAAEVVRLFQSDPAYQTLNPMTGDFVEQGDVPEEWDTQLFSPQFKNIRAEFASLAVTPVMGNHEGSGALFQRYWPMPFVADRYYSFDYGPVHFTLLDQFVDFGKGSAQYDWMQKDLASTRKPWKVVVLHEPGWAAGGGHENNTTVQTDIQPLLEQYGVQLVLTGHDHYYARAVVGSVTHLTVGTGGAPLYTPFSNYPNIVYTHKSTGFVRIEIDGATLTGTFVNNKGQALDTFTLKK